MSKQRDAALRALAGAEELIRDLRLELEAVRSANRALRTDRATLEEHLRRALDRAHFGG